MGIDWVPVKTQGEQELEIDDLQNALSKLDLDGIVAGALRSDYQKTRLERMCERLGIHSFTPLWHQPELIHMRGLVDNGFKVMITGIAADGLGEGWLGKVLDSDSLEKLEQLAAKYRFHIDGEGGEYETLVVGGPHMPTDLDIEFSMHFDGVRGHLEFK